MEIGSTDKAAPSRISLRFRTKAAYGEYELEELLETLGRRGGDCEHLGEGRFKLTVPDDNFWVPFYDTIRACPSVEFTERILVSGKSG